MPTCSGPQPSAVSGAISSAVCESGETPLSAVVSAGALAGRASFVAEPEAASCSGAQDARATAPARSQLRSGHRHYTFLRSEEHTSELQSLMRISYAVLCLKKKTKE